MCESQNIESIYIDYVKFIQTITHENINNSNFKQKSEYTTILEHVSYDLGQKYANLIETEFIDISIENINNYVRLNDYIGNPVKYDFKIKNEIIHASPSSLRYIYHSLIILKHFEYKGNNSIVEVGGGYGGLFLAIDFFSQILNIHINNYYIIDLIDIGNLIKIYLSKHNNIIKTNYSIENADLYGDTIKDDKLFFISNYCFTEINEIHRIGYCNNLLNKVTSGFITWQTGLVSIDKIKFYIKYDCHVKEESPQTSSEFKNYYVKF
jgi:hypothetical protein